MDPEPLSTYPIDDDERVVVIVRNGVYIVALARGGSIVSEHSGWHTVESANSTAAAWAGGIRFDRAYRRSLAS